MNKILRNVVFGVGLALLMVAFASAQDFSVGGVQGVHVHGAVILPPPAPIFSNCGANCTSYNTGSGYYISGSSLSTGANQTLAMGFTPKTGGSFAGALTPNTVYTTNGGASSGTMTAYLLNGTATSGPTTPLARLRQAGTIPDYPTIATIQYHSTTAVTFTAGTTYFLCETEPVANVQLLWMVSNSDLTSPFWFQDSDTCTKKGTVWSNATGAVDGAAFEIK